MSDDLVNRICQQWIDKGYADECFWEVWPPGDPAPEDSLTPRMVLDRIQELEAKLAKAVETLKWQADAIRKSISANHVGPHRVLLKGVYQEGPVVNWAYEVLTGFETINRTILTELTGDADA